MKATVNGVSRDLPEGLTVEALLASLEAPKQGVAVAKNDHVLRRARFHEEIVCEGDRIEIIQAVAGG